MKQRGFQLTEVLISLLLSSIIFMSLSQVYLSTKKFYQQAQSQLIEALEIEWITVLLRDSVRQAGFTPCRGLDYLERNLQNIPASLVIEYATPALIVRRMDSQFNQIIQIKHLTQILVSKMVDVRINHPVLIADCYYAEVNVPIKVTLQNSGQLVTLKKPLSFNYEQAYVGAWIEEKWLVKPNQHGKPALYYHERHTDEISQYINKIKLVKHKGWLSILLSIKQADERELIVRPRSL